MKDVDSSKPGEKMKKLLILSSLLLSPTLFAKIIEKEIKVGKTTTIKLPSNPTTGYVWSYTVTPIDEDLVKITEKFKAAHKEKKEIEQSSFRAQKGEIKDVKEPEKFRTSGMIVGAGGTKIYRIKGLKEGTATVTFIEKRPWEKEKEEKITKKVYRIKVVKPTSSKKEAEKVIHEVPAVPAYQK